MVGAIPDARPVAPKGREDGHLGGASPRVSRSVLLVLVFCAVYLVCSNWLMMRLGFLHHLDDVVFSHPDSKGYLAVAQYIAGKTSSVAAIHVGLRPFLFPLFLCSASVVGIKGFVVLQQVLNVSTIALTFQSVKGLTGSLSLALVGMILVASNLTFTFAALHAISETLSVFLVAAFMLMLSRSVTSEGLSYRLCGLALLSCAVCVKGIFLPFLVLYAILLGIELVRTGALKQSLGWLLLAALPVGTQLLFSSVAAGTASISISGSSNFSTRFFPAVYGYWKNNEFAHYKGPVASEAKQRHPELRGQLGFVLEHPLQTAKATKLLLMDNLLSGSSLVIFPPAAISDVHLSKLLYAASERVNMVLAFAHLIAAVTIAGLLWVGQERHQARFLVLASALVGSIIGLSVLTYAQGDRIVLAALPAWAALYPTLVGWGFSALWARRSGASVVSG